MKKLDMNWQRIEYFLTFCESLHFTNAARRLGISQPALTKAIIQLEEELGTRLIRRDGKHTHLTEHGKAVHRKYVELAHSVNEVSRDISSIIKGGNEKVCVGVMPGVDFSEFAGFLAHFHQRCPTVFLEILECTDIDIEKMLLDSLVDCLLTNNTLANNDRVSVIELYSSGLTIATQSQSAHSRLTYPDQYAQAYQDNFKDPASNKLYSATLHGEPKVVASASQQLWLQHLIKAGLGWGVLSENCTTLSGVSAITDPDNKLKRTTYAMVSSGRNDSETVALFVKTLRNYQWDLEQEIV